MNYIKYEIENYEYRKDINDGEIVDSNIPSEHSWDFMKDDDKANEYFTNREKICYPNIGNVQSNPEMTGQFGTMI